MRVRKYRVTKDVPAITFKQWGGVGNYSGADISEGTVLYEYPHHDYGAINWRNGLALTYSPDGSRPFFEFPNNAVEEIA